MKLSEFIPLAFSPIVDKFGQDYCYIQKWHHTDTIRLQAVSNDVSEIVYAEYIDLATGTPTAITMTATAVGTFYFWDGSVTMIADGIYKIRIYNNSGIEYVSEPFSVSSSLDLLDGTALLRYTSSTDITHFNTRFNQGAIYFEWRIGAGLKPDTFQPKLDDEFYRTQTQEGRHLFSVPYSVWALTIGDAVGVPYYVAELLNKILCLDTVNFENAEIRRSESDVPELSETFSNSQMFIIRQNVELIDAADARIIVSKDYDKDEYNDDYSK